MNGLFWQLCVTSPFNPSQPQWHKQTHMHTEKAALGVGGGGSTNSTNDIWHQHGDEEMWQLFLIIRGQKPVTAPRPQTMAAWPSVQKGNIDCLRCYPFYLFCVDMGRFLNFCWLHGRTALGGKNTSDVSFISTCDHTDQYKSNTALPPMKLKAESRK